MKKLSKKFNPFLSWQNELPTHVTWGCCPTIIKRTCWHFCYLHTSYPRNISMKVPAWYCIWWARTDMSWESYCQALWHNQKLQYYFLKRHLRNPYLNPIPTLLIHFWEITLKLYLGKAGAILLSSLTASVTTASVLSQLWNLTDFWILLHLTPRSPFNSGDFKSFTKSTLIWAVTSMLCCLQAHGLVECKVRPAKDLILSSCF